MMTWSHRNVIIIAIIIIIIIIVIKNRIFSIMK